MKNKVLTFGTVLCSALLGGFLLLRSLAQPSSTNQTTVWQSQDVGRVGQRGTHTEAQGSHVVQGAGADIWSGADAFQFVYQPWEGDVEFTARVVSVEKTDPWAKAGIMIRANLTETSPHAMVALTPEKGPAFIRRLQTGSASKDDSYQAMRLIRKGQNVVFQERGSAGVDKATDSLTALPLPRWIKLVRQRDLLKAYDSSDGITWEWLGTETLSLPAQCYVGLAVSSHDSARLCRAVLEQVAVSRPKSSPNLAAAKVGTGDGLQASYYSKMDFTGTTVQRVDPSINFDWGYGPPANGIGRNNFSVRWEGELEAQFSEPYAIHVISDDRARLWINGELLIDEWYEHGEQTSTVVINLEAGKRYLLRLDYFENRGRAVAKLLWSSPSTPQQAIPQSQLYSRITDQDHDGLPDLWELAHGLNPADPTDADRASNGEDVTNRKKYAEGFERVSKPQSNTQLPASWLSQDVGRIGPEGSAEINGGTWIVKGSGADIWANADGFHFVYQAWRGDGQITARVVSQENTDPWAKAGIMIRETPEATSRHAMLAVTPEHGVVFMHRDEAARTTAQELDRSASGARWLKLVRRGPIVTSFCSTDGVNWQWIGTEAMYLIDEIYVGIAVTSHDNSALATAKFDQVSLDRPSPQKPVTLSIGSGTGLNASYFDGTTGRVVSRLDATVNFDWDIDSPADGIGSDNFSARWEGYLEPQSDEQYAVHVISDDGARLWLDGQLIIDAWFDRGESEDTVKMNLKAGNKYPIKLEYYERTREAIAKLLWSTPNIPKQAIPQSQLYPTISSIGLAMARTPTASAQADSQASKLQSAVPGSVTLQTDEDANQRAAAAPGITGFFNVAERTGAATTSRLGGWETIGTSVYAVDRRGYLDYNLNAPTADMYRLEVEGTTHNLFDIDSGFYLLVSVDGESLGRNVLDAGPGRVGKVQVFTPWLNAGLHHVRLYWDNARKGRSLQVDAVRLQSLQGPDADHNGVKDWVENKIKAENGIETAGQASARAMPPKSAARTPNSAIVSLTSPACLEGRGGYVSMMRATANGQKVAPQHGAGERWYANVPLLDTQNTRVEVSFQNGGLRQSAQILWQPTDLLQSKDLVIRQGDSLLFKVGQASSLDESVEAAEDHVRIEIDGQLKFVGPPARLVPHRFDQIGTFTATGTYSEANGASQKRGVRVKVIAGSFEGSPVAWTGRERVWDCPQIPGEAVLDYDKRIHFIQDAALPQGGKRFRLSVDAGEDRWVLARLGEAGPVFAAAAIRGIEIDGVSESGAFYEKQYDDGSRLVETAVAQSRVFADVRVQLNIIVGGVMFDDGTLVKTLRVEDFDPMGLATVHFIMPPGVQTSNCHIMRAYQNQSYLGEY